MKKIKDAMVAQGMSKKSLFDKLDSNGNGMLSFAEFSSGIDSVVKLSPIVKERFFALMD